MTHENHFTPCLYLKRFANPDGGVFSYKTLVPHEHVREWKLTSPKAVGKLEHLYTRNVNGEDKDDIERWFKHEFEDPAVHPVEKTLADAKLSARDWCRLIRFLAAQYVRTPGYYFANVNRWHASISEILKATCHQVASKLEARPVPLKSTAEAYSIPSTPRLNLSEYLAVGVEFNITPGEPMGSLRLSSVVGRNTWIAGMLAILQGNACDLLQSYRWTILRPSQGYTWFTSDHPVVVMNVSPGEKINFRAGIGQLGTQIFLPLDPHHLMYTEVGGHIPPRGFQLDSADTRAFRAIMAAHAFRAVFSANQDDEIPKLRPRIVDQKQFCFERMGQQEWHSNQTTAENNLRRRSA